jgi:polysaccharide export outer membrane protein
MNRGKLLLFGSISALILMSGCGINNNIILKTGRGFKYDDLPISAPQEYVISPGDNLSFQLYKNNGAMLIESGAGGAGGGARAGANNGNNAGYSVRYNGNVELPYLGDINLTGMTVKAAEDSLEVAYSKYFKDIFAILQVTNKRIFISPGGVGDAQVIILPNNTTTLLEAIAMAGGINDRGNSKIIKVIRKKGDDIKVYKINLSNIEGLHDAGFIVQANDFIYVEPMKQVASETIQVITPILGLISTALLIYALATTNPFN